MSQDDFSDLKQLWQTEKPAKTVNIAALTRRYARQRFMMIANLMLELLLLIATTLLAIWLAFDSEQFSSFVFVTFMCIWGWLLFIPLTISRWRSFHMLKTAAINESVTQHLEILRQTQLRWKVCGIATAFLALTVIFLLAIDQQQWLLLNRAENFGLVALLALICVVCYYNYRRCKHSVSALTE